MSAIPKRLLDEISDGNVVLFLGAGATVGATDGTGGAPPIGNQLADRLASEFLGEEYLGEPLDYVADVARSTASLYEVQDFVREIFEEYQPADFHCLLPQFRWRGIATTNFDLIVERAYQQDEGLQRLQPIRTNTQDLDEALHDPNVVPYLKLHGCITRTRDDSNPLTLATDQYLASKQQRSRLFNAFEDWAFERPTVFVGHELRDTDIRESLRAVEEIGEGHPRHYLVKPSVPDAEREMWSSRKVSVLDATFEEFLNEVDRRIDRDKRKLSGLIEGDHHIRRHFRIDESVPDTLSSYLETKADLIHAGMSTDKGSPEAFYKGADLGWYPIERDLDVRRRLVDNLLFDVVIPDTERQANVELYVVTAEAGAGKSVLLRRVAWEAATEADRLTIYHREYAELDYSALSQLHRLTQKRICLFVDDAPDNVGEITRLLDAARADEMPLTVFSAARVNEWNHVRDSYDVYLTDTYELYYLSEDEIETLVKKLEENDCLNRLKPYSHEQRVERLTKKAGRQLLVALHEATEDRRFEDIVYDEYQEIQPPKARRLYRTVCVLNRLRVPVRAGLIARIYGIGFNEFREKFFKPLERVVITSESYAYPIYKARHPRIAELVFRRALGDPDHRLDEYLRILDAMNLSYRTDEEAFRRLIKASTVDEALADYQDARRVYEKAEEMAADDFVFWHQRGLYEKSRASGSIGRAREYLERAQSLNPNSSGVVHSLAELDLTAARRSEARLAREKLRDRAKSLAQSIVDDPNSGTYARHTILKVELDRLEEAIESEDSTEEEIEQLIRGIEKQVFASRQKTGDDSYLRTAEARLHNILEEYERALDALKTGFKRNPGDSFIASRLAESFVERGDRTEAVKVLRSAVDVNPQDQSLNYQLAEALRKTGGKQEDLIHYYGRSFTRGDQHHLAHFWYARYCYEEDQRREEAKEIFKLLSDKPIPKQQRDAIRDYVTEDGEKEAFYGEVEHREPTWGFITVDGIGESIFAHRSGMAPGFDWDALNVNDRLGFHIGFTMRGPVADRIMEEKEV